MFHVKHLTALLYRGCDMAFLKEFKALFKRINEELEKWDFLGVKPNEVRHAEHMLEMFYDWVGKKPKDNTRFNTRLKLTNDQQDELEEIALSFADMEIYSDNYYDESFMKAFEKVKGRYGINTIEQYRDYVDAKDRYRDERLISSILSWYEYEKLKQKYSKKYKREVSESELNELIKSIYFDTGKEHDDLYEFVYKNL